MDATDASSCIRRFTVDAVERVSAGCVVVVESDVPLTSDSDHMLLSGDSGFYEPLRRSLNKAIGQRPQENLAGTALAAGKRTKL